MFLYATHENPGLCAMLPRQNAHLPCVNSAFVSVASLDSEVFGGCLYEILINPDIRNIIISGNIIRP